MSKSFDQFHLSLIEKEQGDLLTVALNREHWLRSKFKDRFDFNHHGKQFHWVPQNLSNEFVVGVVERQKLKNQRKPPEEGAEEFEGHYWTGSMVIVDPVDRDKGQHVAFENHPEVGEAKAILASMVAAINSDASLQYTVFFKPLFRGDSFWEFARKNGNQLEYVAFKFTVPNMIFGAGGSVKDGLRRIGKDTDADEIEVKLESSTGVRADSKSVKEAIAYGEDGNARVTARSVDGKYWSSTSRKLSVKMQSILNFSNAKAKDINEWLRLALARDASSNDSGFDNPDDWGRGS